MTVSERFQIGKPKVAQISPRLLNTIGRLVHKLFVLRQSQRSLNPSSQGIRALLHLAYFERAFWRTIVSRPEK